MIPLFVMLASAYLVVGPIVYNPQVQYLYALAFIVVGLIAYVPFVYYQKAAPGLSKLNPYQSFLSWSPVLVPSFGILYESWDGFSWRQLKSNYLFLQIPFEVSCKSCCWSHQRHHIKNSQYGIFIEQKYRQRISYRRPIQTMYKSKMPLPTRSIPVRLLFAT